jgi:hypothetical protein
MDFVLLLNQLIPQLLPNLNNDLPTAIENANLDPWENVYSHTDTIEGVEVGYSITDMTGLSATTITEITILTAEPSLPTITGTMTVDAKLEKNLAATLTGKISGKVGPFHKDVEISGEITATSVTATTTGATYSATFAEGSLMVTEMTLKGLSFSYGNLTVTVNGLGSFGKVLGPLIALITTAFKGLITSQISSKVQPVLNTEIAAPLPFPKPDTGDEIQDQ